MAEDDSPRRSKRPRKSPPGTHTDYSGDPGLVNKDICRVKRKLWEVDQDQVTDDVQRELKRVRRDESLQKSSKWNFDFEREKPLSGDWQWQDTTNVPKFYKSTVAHSSKHPSPTSSRLLYPAAVICTVQIPCIPSPSIVTRSVTAATVPTSSVPATPKPCTRSHSKSLPVSPIRPEKPPTLTSIYRTRRRLRRRSAPVLSIHDKNNVKTQLKDRTLWVKNVRKKKKKI